MGLILTDLLLESGFLKGDRDQLYKDRLFSYFCPHSLGMPDDEDTMRLLFCFFVHLIRD
jgi:hypothetical protein